MLGKEGVCRGASEVVRGAWVNFRFARLIFWVFGRGFSLISFGGVVEESTAVSSSGVVAAGFVLSEAPP